MTDGQLALDVLTKLVRGSDGDEQYDLGHGYRSWHIGNPHTLTVDDTVALTFDEIALVERLST